MTGLRSLQIFGNNLTNAGLTVTLDNCNQLESLNIRHCFNVEMDNTLRAKCAGIKTLRLPDDSTDDYDFIVLPPVWADHFHSEDDSDDGYTGPMFTMSWTPISMMTISITPIPRYVQETTYPVSDMYRIRIRQGYTGDTYPSRIGVLGRNGS